MSRLICDVVSDAYVLVCLHVIARCVPTVQITVINLFNSYASVDLLNMMATLHIWAYLIRPTAAVTTTCFPAAIDPPKKSSLLNFSKGLESFPPSLLIVIHHTIEPAQEAREGRHKTS